MSETVRHPYKSERVRVGVDASEPVITKQSEKVKTDINKIVAKYVRAGGVPPLPADTRFGFAPEMTFHDAMNKIAEADEYFMTLPAEARKRFENDAGAFLEFIDDPANIDEMVEMGLLERPSEAQGEGPGAEAAAPPAEAAPVAPEPAQ